MPTVAVKPNDRDSRGSRVSNQLKVVLLGGLSNGKTTLLNALQGQAYPLTKVDARTIHLDIVKVTIPRTGEASDLILLVYDCGGWDGYAVGQIPFLSGSALYLLAVEANETDPQKFLRLLVLFQARAPNAVVQIVLTKTDLVPNPEEKAKWVLNAVNKHNDKWRKHGKGETKPLRIQPDVIMTSVMDDQEGTREKMIAGILNVLHLTPTVGQVVPNTWAVVWALATALQMYGTGHKDTLFDAVQLEAENKLAGVPSAKVSNGDGIAYCRISEFQGLFEDYCAYKTSKDANAIVSPLVLNDALHLYEAQGDIYISGDLIFLNPTLIADLMKALMDHTLTTKRLKSQEFRSVMVEYIEGAEISFKKLKQDMESFVTSGELHGPYILPFLLRNVKRLKMLSPPLRKFLTINSLLV